MPPDPPTNLWTVEPMPVDDEPRPVVVDVIGADAGTGEIHHRDGSCPEPERCLPRLVARCRSCRRGFVLCTATTAEVRAMLRRGWICGTCEGRA